MKEKRTNEKTFLRCFEMKRNALPRLEARGREDAASIEARGREDAASIFPLCSICRKVHEKEFERVERDRVRMGKLEKAKYYGNEMGNERKNRCLRKRD